MVSDDSPHLSQNHIILLIAKLDPNNITEVSLSMDIFISNISTKNILLKNLKYCILVLLNHSTNLYPYN